MQSFRTLYFTYIIVLLLYRKSIVLELKGYEGSSLQYIGSVINGAYPV